MHLRCMILGKTCKASPVAIGATGTAHATGTTCANLYALYDGVTKSHIAPVKKRKKLQYVMTCAGIKE